MAGRERGGAFFFSFGFSPHPEQMSVIGAAAPLLPILRVLLLLLLWARLPARAQTQTAALAASGQGNKKHTAHLTKPFLFTQQCTTHHIHILRTPIPCHQLGPVTSPPHTHTFLLYLLPLPQHHRCPPCLTHTCPPNHSIHSPVGLYFQLVGA